MSFKKVLNVKALVVCEPSFNLRLKLYSLLSPDRGSLARVAVGCWARGDFMSYFMETICKLYIGGCIAAGEGGAQPGEGEGEREGDKGEEPALQHSGRRLWQLGVMI